MTSFSKLEAIRGFIVRALYVDSNRTLSDQALLAVIRGYGYDDFSIEDIRREIGYLASAGFLVSKSKNRDLCLATLSHKGVDLHEGRIQVDGVTIT